ncbi:T9SS type A sorting domain-containing protein [Luteirhabdus pelagi]|uniref:T9SS type A sorting domain-containing protein n=1 Tax=Luteirhabdus pelagi TaxID=2792783 RepID=UPI0019397422|nr:T9SS type A sorting domain-containing protein [Luteirhabdus pelagi]
MKINYVITAILMMAGSFAFAQDASNLGPTDAGLMAPPHVVPSIAEQMRNGTFIEADNTPMEGKPKRKIGNTIVPGKGSSGIDGALQTDPPFRTGKAPILTFEADISQATPSDPTGAAGPNHFIGGWNSAFRIFDKTGTPLTGEASLATIFPGNAIGDPIIFFDPYIENEPGEPRGRFVITEFDNNPNGFNVAVCQGPDPVNDGWYVYTTGFGTGAFPDYTKFALWSDAYYVTANIGSSNRVFAVEREKMAKGEPAQFLAFPLPGIATNGFYSPHGFNATGGSEPEIGNFPLVYLQDDAWGGVSEDHLKIWTINVDWDTPSNSTISNPAQIIPTTDFISVFDFGSFANLDQPAGPDIDALQATVMNQAQFRMFDGYNSALLNFVVDTDPTGGELAGIRWYELRQTEQGEPWTIHQEGTYTAPDGRHAFSGSMAMDIFGNIGIGYSSLSSTESLSIRYTGRLADDPLGDMTIAEELIAQGGNSPTTRVADYVHLSIDPTNDQTFWHIAEYFDPTRRDVVGVFEHAVPEANDVAIINLTPNTGELTDAEEITVEIQNYGTATQSNIPVSYSIDGGALVEETYTGSLAPGAVDTYTFSETADLSGLQTYRIETRTSLGTDAFSENDIYGENVRNEEELSIADLQIENAELIISSADNKHFDIQLRTIYDDKLHLAVYDINGKLLTSNYLVNEGGRYTYNLDMSYVASGTYLVSLGEGELQKSSKIIVR